MKALDLVEIGKLDFEPLDLARFPCLVLAREAAAAEQSLAIALNAANEIAVQAFLDELIRYTAIPIVIEQVLSKTCAEEANTIDAIQAIDAESRRQAAEAVKQQTT